MMPYPTTSPQLKVGQKWLNRPSTSNENFVNEVTIRELSPSGTCFRYDYLDFQSGETRTTRWKSVDAYVWLDLMDQGDVT